MLNKRGSNIDPCGTPNKVYSQELKLSLIFIRCFLLDKKSQGTQTKTISVQFRY